MYNITFKAPLLIMFCFVMTQCKSQVKHQSLLPDNYQTELDSLINAHLDQDNIPSIALGIVKDGKQFLATAYGYADLEEQLPATEHTIYQIGSVTKMFTGRVLAHLTAESKIKLNDRISNCFPKEIRFPTSPTGQEVRIIDIATHSAEFPRYPDNLERVDPYPIEGYAREEMYSGISHVKIDTTIGIRYRYSNYGYGVLGTALENNTGKSLNQLMEDFIFRPFEMEHSSLVQDKEIQENLATPYLQVDPPEPTQPWKMETLAGAGNVFSNVIDLNKFIIELMKADSINTIQQQKYLKINDTWSYGLGCFIIDSAEKNTTIIYHGGDVDGYASSLTLYPEKKFGFVILTNWGEGQVIGEAFTAIDRWIVDKLLD